MYAVFCQDFPRHFELNNLYEHSVPVVAHIGIFLSEMCYKFLCCGPSTSFNYASVDFCVYDIAQYFWNKKGTGRKCAMCTKLEVLQLSQVHWQ
jgi:hypothetical protein